MTTKKKTRATAPLPSTGVSPSRAAVLDRELIPAATQTGAFATAPEGRTAFARTQDRQRAQNRADAAASEPIVVARATTGERPTAREGLKPIGDEKPHPTAAAREGKTSGEGRVGLDYDLSPEATASSRTSARPLTVQATQLGYYDHTRRRTGDVFKIAAPEDFSKRWMRRVADNTPTRITLGNQAIAKEHDEILSLRQAGTQRAPTGNEDVLGD